ncbi:hypothetical protein Plhal304r1_c086g0169491 [Plasmopara halstedii]
MLATTFKQVAEMVKDQGMLSSFLFFSPLFSSMDDRNDYDMEQVDEKLRSGIG